MTLDHDLLFFDFAREYENHPDEAVYALQAMVLNEVACRARVAFLRALTHQAERDNLEQRLGRAEPAGDFAPEIRTIVREGIFEPLERGLLIPERLAALTRDPDALWRLHRELRAVPPETPDTPAPSSAAAPTTSRPGFTSLVVGRRWADLEDRLRPYLPAVMQHVGLELAHHDALLDFLIERARTDDLAGLRFRDRIPEWLDSFASRAGRAPLPRRLREEDWAAIIERTVVRLVLDDVPASEPDWAREFRAIARRRGASSWRDLMPITLPEDQALPDDVQIFRRHLVGRIQDGYDQAQQFFELN